jgi:hypothetical protein
MKGMRITIRIEDADKQKIDAYIKREYPKVKTVSETVRAALSKFFQEAD